MRIRVSVGKGDGKAGSGCCDVKKSSAACGHVSEAFQKGGGFLLLKCGENAR